MANPTTIRELLVHLGVTTDAKALAEFDQGLAYIKAGMAQAARMAAGLAAGFTGLAAGMGYLANESADVASELTQTATALGLSTDAVQEYRHAFDQASIGAENVTPVFAKLSQQADATLKGSAELAGAFRTLGLSVSDLRNRKPDELFEAMADGAARVEDPVQRLNALTKIFGDGAAQTLAPALANGARGLRELREEARAYGLVMDEELIQQAAEAQSRFGLLRAVLRGLRTEIGLHLIPVVQEAVNWALEWFRANRLWLRLKIRESIEGIRRGFMELRRRALELNELVYERFGGWRNLLESAAKAVALLAGARGLLALVRGLMAVRQTVMGAKAALAAMTASAVVTLGLVVALAAAFVALVLAIDDLAAFYRGGDSIIGNLAKAVGLDDELMEALHEIIAAWRDLKAAVGEFVGVVRDELGPALGPLGEGLKSLIKIGVKLWIEDIIEAVEALTGAIQTLSGVIRGDLEQTAKGLRNVAKVGDITGAVAVAPALPMVGPQGQLAMRAGAWGLDWLRGVMDREQPAQSNVNQSVTIQGHTWNVSGASVPDLEAMQHRIDEENRKHAMAVFGGGPR